jgi:acyl-CoA thioesterase
MTEPKLSPAEAQALADATAEAMFSRDRAAQALGIKIVRVQPGASLLTMEVRSDMVNGHHICHGDRKSTRLNSSHRLTSRMPSSA